jgi:hypothetical protein
MINLEEPIAVGRTAEIFSYGDGKVLKLFLSTTPLLWIEKEAETGPYIQKMGLPVPRVYERVKINEREGIIYEKVEGPALLTELAKQPWKVAVYARMLARLHAQVHAALGAEHLDHPAKWATGIQRRITGRPASERVASARGAAGWKPPWHGDFHPAISSSANAPIIID